MRWPTQITDEAVEAIAEFGGIEPAKVAYLIRFTLEVNGPDVENLLQAAIDYAKAIPAECLENPGLESSCQCANHLRARSAGAAIERVLDEWRSA